MTENLKNKLVVILGIATTVFFFSTISSCNNSARLKAAKDKEMSQRLALEEKVNKFAQEKASLEEKIKAEANELETEKAAHALDKKTLAQEQQVSASLKEELDKVAKLKENSVNKPQSAAMDKQIKK